MLKTHDFKNSTLAPIKKCFCSGESLHGHHWVKVAADQIGEKKIFS